MTSSRAWHRLCCPSSLRSSSEQGRLWAGGPLLQQPCFGVEAAVDDVRTPGVAGFQNTGLGKGGWRTPRSAALCRGPSGPSASVIHAGFWPLGGPWLPCHPPAHEFSYQLHPLALFVISKVFSRQAPPPQGGLLFSGVLSPPVCPCALWHAPFPLGRFPQQPLLLTPPGGGLCPCGQDPGRRVSP